MANTDTFSVVQQKLPITRSVTFLMVALLLLSGLLLTALVYQQHQAFLAHQQEMSQRALQNSGEQIGLYLDRERQLLAMFAEAWQDDLHRWVKKPANQAQKAPFWHDLQRIMPRVKNFTLTDWRGDLHLADPEGLIGASCRQDIRYYARYQMPNEIFVHQNSQGSHIDLVTRLPSRSATDQAHYFVVSLDLSALTNILKRSQPLHHQLWLQRRGNSKLELSAEGVSKDLSEGSASYISQPLSVSGTRWQLFDRIDARFIAQNSWWAVWLVVSSLLLLIAPVVGMLWLVAREERRRLRVEQSLAESHRHLERRVMERSADLMFVTAHDPLTQLLNRSELEWRLQQTLIDVNNKQSESMLCVLGVDRFKLINENSGYPVGDQLLKWVAKLLLSELRDGDTLVRLGSDEFALIFYNCSSSEGERLAEQFRQRIRQQSFEWQDETFEISISLGLVMINAASHGKTSLLSLADRACYTAKQQGRDQVYFFDPVEENVAGRGALLRRSQDVATALTTGALELHCQPLMPLLETQLLPRYEALIRMRGEDGNLLLPDLFIPAAERFGRMSEVDLWVTEEALKALQSSKTALYLGVNLSGQTLSNPVNVKQFGDLLARYADVTYNLCFEITESAALSDFSQVILFMEQMRQWGCRFALDDYGSGACSFSYLRNLPVDVLKIDGELILAMRDDEVAVAMVNSIVIMAKSMQMVCVAEYVEDEALLQQVRSLKIDYAQGRHIGKTLPLTDVVAALAKD